MAGTIRQTYNERTGEALNPITESNAVEWTPNMAFNLTQIIETIQQNASSLSMRVDDLEADVEINTQNINTNAHNIAVNAENIAQKANNDEVVKNAIANNYAQQELNGTLKFNGRSADSAASIFMYDKDGNIFLNINAGNSQFGRTGFETAIVSKAADLIHNRTGEGSFPIWDTYNLSIETVNALKDILNSAVRKTGDETINGIKTFSAIPVLPSTDPTTINQATRKGYVDSQNLLKQDKLIAGDNITIAPDGKTISATASGGSSEMEIEVIPISSEEPPTQLNPKGNTIYSFDGSTSTPIPVLFKSTTLGGVNKPGQHIIVEGAPDLQFDFQSDDMGNILHSENWDSPIGANVRSVRYDCLISYNSVFIEKELFDAVY